MAGTPVGNGRVNNKTQASFLWQVGQGAGKGEGVDGKRPFVKH